MQAFAKVWSPPSGTLGRLVQEAWARAAELEPRAGELRRAALHAPPAPPFAGALCGPHVAVIAELKRRSPSKGDINPALEAGERCAAYARGGAAALSILTEPAHFGGRPADITDARARVIIPLLKKDFHVHPAQLAEARVLGASAALLIARALSPAELAQLAREAEELGLETLVEVRDEWELERAVRARATAIGVNNRDLETLSIDAAVSARLVPLIPAETPAVYESGVRTADEVREAAALGADAVLVGSSISASDDAEGSVRALASVPRVPRARDVA